MTKQTLDPELAHWRLEPLPMEEILAEVHDPSGSINKHLLTLYSLILGLNAQRAIDLGTGSTTRVIKTALQKTGGELFSCDWDQEKWKQVPEVDETGKFHFAATDSKSFLEKMKGPFDFVLHDAAHDLWQVKEDLERIWPMMRQYGIICIHDTQHSLLGSDMHAAIKEAFQDCPISMTHLPYQYGFTIIRIEKEQPYEPIQTTWKKEGYPGETKLHTCGTITFDGSSIQPQGSFLKFCKWRLKRLLGKKS